MLGAKIDFVLTDSRQSQPNDPSSHFGQLRYVVLHTAASQLKTTAT